MNRNHSEYRLSYWETTLHCSCVHIKNLVIGSAIERRRCMVTPPLTCCAHTQIHAWYPNRLSCNSFQMVSVFNTPVISLYLTTYTKFEIFFQSKSRSNFTYISTYEVLQCIILHCIVFGFLHVAQSAVPTLMSSHLITAILCAITPTTYSSIVSDSVYFENIFSIQNLPERNTDLYIQLRPMLSLKYILYIKYRIHSNERCLGIICSIIK